MMKGFVFAILLSFMGSSQLFADEYMTVFNKKKQVDADFEIETKKLSRFNDAQRAIDDSLFTLKSDLNMMGAASRDMSAFAEPILRLALSSSWNDMIDRDREAYLKALCGNGFKTLVKDAPKFSNGKANFNSSPNLLETYDDYEKGHFKFGFLDYIKYFEKFTSRGKLLDALEKKPSQEFARKDIVNPRMQCRASVVQATSAALAKLQPEFDMVKSFCTPQHPKSFSLLSSAVDALKDAVSTGLRSYEQCTTFFPEALVDAYKKTVDDRLDQRFNALLKESIALRKQLVEIQNNWKKEEAAREERYQQSKQTKKTGHGDIKK